MSVLSTNDFVPCFCFRRPDTPEARKRSSHLKGELDGNQKSNVTLEDRVPKTFCELTKFSAKCEQVSRYAAS